MEETHLWDFGFAKDLSLRQDLLLPSHPFRLHAFPYFVWPDALSD